MVQNTKICNFIPYIHHGWDSTHPCQRIPHFTSEAIELIELLDSYWIQHVASIDASSNLVFFFEIGNKKEEMFSSVT